jgi:hypothetical protein
MCRFASDDEPASDAARKRGELALKLSLMVRKRVFGSSSVALPQF